MASAYKPMDALTAELTAYRTMTLREALGRNAEVDLVAVVRAAGPEAQAVVILT
jgi:hypothetical protein